MCCTNVGLAQPQGKVGSNSLYRSREVQGPGTLRPLVRGCLRDVAWVEVSEKRSDIYTGVRLGFSRDVEHGIASVRRSA